MGFLQKLFGNKASEVPGTMSAQKATAIIQQYGSFLEHGAPNPGCVADVTKLPFAKAEIKRALLLGLKSIAEPEAREVLRAGYLQLADWQEGVGDSDQGIDVSGFDPAEDPLKMAEKVLAQSEGHEKWSPIVEAERLMLRDELQRAGMW